MALILPGMSIAGSLDPPAGAVDGSGNPIPTMQPKMACRGEFLSDGYWTVTDCKTGLIWMVNANYFGSQTWYEALESCSTYTLGGSNWHLPTIEELKTLPNRNYPNPALSNAKGDAKWAEGNAFFLVQSSYYWSATTDASYPESAWTMYMGDGSVGYSSSKESKHFVWCVRGGQSIEAY
jgi:hypothetical protein